MKKYDIWSEGYSITGNYSGAIYHESIESDSFKNACITYFKDNTYFNSHDLTYWGCRLYPNENKARETFG